MPLSPVTPTVPWHMWGTSVLLRPTRGAGGVDSHQIARVNYKRPETWSFFIAARLIDGPVNPDPVDEVVVTVNVNLILGIGRSNYDTAQRTALEWGFARFRFYVAAGQRPGDNFQNHKYTTTVLSPLTDDGDDTSHIAMDHICAQDLQAIGQAIIGPAPAGYAGTIVTEVSAYFSPWVHMRPDWFRDQDESACYLGSEVGGT